MGDVSLSKAVRSNLLSLQSTANMMAKTQTRLATGLKVNTALDNPTNFFTAASLNGRAGDMSNLLDSMSNGLKTIEAADNGLTSITKTVESMQSTLRQARQDKSFKTQSFTLPSGTPDSSEQLTLGGGSLGASKSISLTTGGAPGNLVPLYSLAAADFQQIDGTARPIVTSARAEYNSFTSSSFADGDTLDVTVNVNGTPSTVSIGASDVRSFGNGDQTIDDAFELADILNAKFDASGVTAKLVNLSATQFAIFDTTSPAVDGSTFSVSEVVHNQGGAGTVTGLGLGSGNFVAAQAVASGSFYPLMTITIDGNAPKSIGVTDDPSDGDNSITTIQELADGINTEYGSNVASINSVTGALEIRSPTSGPGSGVRVTVFSQDGNTAGMVDSPITPPTPSSRKSVDELVQEINADSDLNASVRASNDNGKLRIENLSTADLSVSGSVGSSTIGGNDVRKNLIKQFNDLRDQLDKFADDASYNGINLLRGDKLKLTFNETGTSTIEIQAEKEDGSPTSVNNAALAIDTAEDGDFDSDSAIDGRLDKLKDALNSLRSQSSTFGSNLSVVENRNDFTRKMINTLETGAANLTLADTNEEAANLLALQTRQQLSSTALSMASQADQAVLRLF